MYAVRRTALSLFTRLFSEKGLTSCHSVHYQYNDKPCIDVIFDNEMTRLCVSFLLNYAESFSWKETTALMPETLKSQMEELKICLSTCHMRLVNVGTTQTYADQIAVTRYYDRLPYIGIIQNGSIITPRFDGDKRKQYEEKIGVSGSRNPFRIPLGDPSLWLSQKIEDLADMDDYEEMFRRHVKLFVRRNEITPIQELWTPKNCPTFNDVLKFYEDNFNIFYLRPELAPLFAVPWELKLLGTQDENPHLSTTTNVCGNIQTQSEHKAEKGDALDVSAFRAKLMASLNKDNMEREEHFNANLKAAFQEEKSMYHLQKMLNFILRKVGYYSNARWECPEDFEGASHSSSPGQPSYFDFGDDQQEGQTIPHKSSAMRRVYRERASIERGTAEGGMRGGYRGGGASGRGTTGGGTRGRGNQPRGSRGGGTTRRGTRC